jgi:hypothetical protein
LGIASTKCDIVATGVFRMVGQMVEINEK